MSLPHDLYLALRGLIRNPGFASVAILTIALGIGVNAAIFSVVNAIVLSPLPYANPERLVDPWPDTPVSVSQYVFFQSRAQAFEHLVGYGNSRISLTGDGDPVVLPGENVSWNYFETLGRHPRLGRSFTPRDSEPGGEPVVILSHGLWMRRYGGDPGILDQTILLDGKGDSPSRIVGVMPAGFRSMHERSELWTPLNIDPSDVAAYEHWASLDMIGRLKDGVTLAFAGDEMNRIAAEFSSADASTSSGRVPKTGVLSLADSIVGDVRPVILLILGAAAIVLLIAGTNVTNLLLARSHARESEFAIRAAIGAVRSRIVKQVLTESVLLGVLGGVLGLFLAMWVVSGFSSILPESIPRRDEIQLDAAVLAYTFALSVVVGLLLGIIPSLRAVIASGRQVLSLRSGQASMTRRGFRLNNGLVTLELAFLVVLIIGAGLLLKSFWKVQNVDVGFRPEGLLSVHLVPPETLVGEPDQTLAYYRELIERVEALPRVTSAAVMSYAPLSGPSPGFNYAPLDDLPPPGAPRLTANYRTVSPDYFSTLGIPLLEGRDFSEVDHAGTIDVIIVNETLARKHWPNESAVGKELASADGNPFAVIVGVVGDVRARRIDRESKPTAYFPHAQDADMGSMYVLLRLTDEPNAVIPAVRAAIWSIDRDVPIREMVSMVDVVRRSVADSRLITIVFSAFAVLALLLGSIGVYGVLTYTVARQKRAIGIRMALGATRGIVMTSTVWRGMIPVVVGVIVGELGAWVACRMLVNLLYQVQPTDLGVYAGVAGFLGLIALIACIFPARRAANVNPIQVLRSEQ